MTIDTSIVITDPFGNKLLQTKEFLEIGNNPGLHYVLACGQVGALTVTLPPEFNPLLLRDGRIHVMRSVNGAPAQREGESCYLIRRWDYADNYTTVTALHANDLIRRRYNLYNYTGPDGAINFLTIPADDAIKGLWNWNNGPPSLPGTANRCPDTSSLVGGLGQPPDTQFDISSYVSVQANVSAAPTIRKIDMYWRNLLDIFTEVEDYSMNAGTFLTAEIVTPAENTLELRTYTGQRGVDRRFSTGNGLLFASVRGNLENAILTFDAIEEKTFVQSLGAGQVTATRYSSRWQDATRMAQSPFGRIETIVDAGSTPGGPGESALYQVARPYVRAGRPIIQAYGDLTDTDQCIRGVHYNFGDMVTVDIRGIQYDMRFDLLDVTISGGRERTIAKFQYSNE